VGPLVSGIYAGDPEQLSLRATFPEVFEAEESAGSVIRGMKKKSKDSAAPRPTGKLLSFKDGNETLMRALAANLGSALRTGMEVLRIRNEGSGHGRRGSRFVLEALGEAGLETIIADRLVLATPADVAAHLLEQSAAEVQVPLREIVYAPMAVVRLGMPLRRLAGCSMDSDFWCRARPEYEFWEAYGIRFFFRGVRRTETC